MAASFQDFIVVCFRFMFSDIAPRRWCLTIRKNILVLSSRVEMPKKTDSLHHFEPYILDHYADSKRQVQSSQ